MRSFDTGSQRMAREMAKSIGREVKLARTNLALTRFGAAKLAGVSPSTQQRVEDGDPSVGIDTACRVASAIGLKLWAKAFPVRTPTLRDTGQIRIAEHLRRTTASATRITFELGLGNMRSIDAVLFGPDEIIALEIERLIADFQSQYRSAAAKRDELAHVHRRPVRLVIAVEDSRRNRTAVRAHAAFLGSVLPAGSREILRALRYGRPLGRDGLLWVRAADGPPILRH